MRLIVTSQPIGDHLWSSITSETLSYYMELIFLLIIVTFATDQLIFSADSILTWRLSAKPLFRPLTREESCLKLRDRVKSGLPQLEDVWSALALRAKTNLAGPCWRPKKATFPILLELVCKIQHTAWPPIHIEIHSVLQCIKVYYTPEPFLKQKTRLWELTYLRRMLRWSRSCTCTTLIS